MYDTHIHSKNSHDSQQTLDEICLSAIEKGMSGISITDHADILYYDKHNTPGRIATSIAETLQASDRYKDRLQVFCGIELGEYIYDTERSNFLLSLVDYDIVLGSVHCVKFEDWEDPYSQISFDKTVPEEKIMGFLDKYLSDVKLISENMDMDVLTHLTCPLRYINGKYGRSIDISEFISYTDTILKNIIERNIALEINTSGLNTPFNELMPDIDIIKRYRKLGGSLITIASDAHVADNIGNGFKQAFKILKAIGFDSYYYFKNRKPCKILL